MLYKIGIFFLFSSVYSTNLPCAQYEGDGGLVCVCNSTYCDTITTPKKLKTGKYYHYTTSETSPGFNMQKGTFGTSYRLGNTSSSVTVNVDPSVTYQTLRGMGVGISDSSAYDFNLLSTNAQNKLIQSYFGEKGIDMIFGRIPVGPTDFSLSYYSYDDTVDDDDMSDFNLTEFELTTKLPMILRAYEASSRGLKLLATPWTPPSWMKDNNDTSPGFILSEYNEAFANYLIKFLEAYEEQGIEFWGLSEGNEVIMGYTTDFSMPNFMMFPNALREWTRDYLGPMLDDAGFENLTIITYDDERDSLTWYADRLLSDNETASYIDGFAVHWYGDESNNVDILDDFHTNYPDHFLIMTEASGGGGGMKATSTGDSSDLTLGDWSEGVTFLEDIFQNFNHWVEGYMTWNLCLNLEGGPYKQMALDSPILIDTSNDLFYKQPTFYLFGHFSKFIQPGSVRINITVEQNTTSSVAWWPLSFLASSGNTTGGPGPQPTGGSFTGGPGPQPTGGSFTGGPDPQPTSTSSPSSSDFSGLATTNPDGSTTVILFNPSSSEVSLTLVDSVKGTIETTLEANSLNTFLYW